VIQETRSGYDRITQVLDYFSEPGLVDWKMKVGKKEAKRISTIALKIGSKVDAIIKGTEKPKKSDPQEVRNCIEGFNRWKADYKVTDSELVFPNRFYDDIEMLTGEADCIYKDTLIDFKCSRAISKRYWLQVSKYSSYYSVFKVGILRFDKNTSEYEFKTNDDIGLSVPDGISIFNGLCNAYRFLKESLEEDETNGPNQDSPSNEKVGS
jgi:hypothetical protein